MPKKFNLHLLKMLLFSVIINLSAFAFSPSFSNGDSSSLPSIQSIQEAAQLGDNVIINGKGNIAFEWAKDDSASTRARELYQKAMDDTPAGAFKVIVNSKKIDLFIAFDGPKIRCDENTIDLMPTGKTFNRWWQSAYNGEKLDLLRLDGIGTNNLILPIGSIQKDNIISVNKYDPRYFGMCISGVPVSVFLQGNASEGKLQNLQITGKEIQNSILCTIIEADVVNSDLHYKLWLDPGKMYRPLHIEKQTKTGLASIQNTFREFEGNVWFPENISIKNFYFETSSQTFVLEEHFSLSVSPDFVINTEVVDSLFEIAFPKGLSVYDIRTGSSFIVQ
jgi:hypothetical protein